MFWENFNISDVHIFGIFRPRLRLNSGDIQIQSFLRNEKVPLNNMAFVTYFQAFQLRRILPYDHVVNLIFMDGKIKSYMKICHSECLDCGVEWQNS